MLRSSGPGLTRWTKMFSPAGLRVSFLTFYFGSGSSTEGIPKYRRELKSYYVAGKIKQASKDFFDFR